MEINLKSQTYKGQHKYVLHLLKLGLLRFGLHHLHAIKTHRTSFFETQKKMLGTTSQLASVSMHFHCMMQKDATIVNGDCSCHST